LKDVALQLTWLDIFFAAVALISLGFNIVQYVESRKSFRPLKSNLTALFNDIKGKALFAHQAQNVLFSQNNPHSTYETLRWEYALFCQAMITSFQGLQESVVGILVAVDPKDREGKEAFRAATYGLTAEETEFRKRSFSNWQNQYLGAGTAVAPSQDASPNDKGGAA